MAGERHAIDDERQLATRLGLHAVRTIFVAVAGAAITLNLGSHNAQAAPREDPGIDISLPGSTLDAPAQSTRENSGDRPTDVGQRLPNAGEDTDVITLPGGSPLEETQVEASDEQPSDSEEPPVNDTEQPVTLPGAEGLPLPVPAPSGQQTPSPSAPSRPEEGSEETSPSSEEQTTSAPPVPESPAREMVGDIEYFNQHDTPWANQYYAGGGSGSIDNNGCGPTTLAMAVSTLSDHDVTPIDMANQLMELGSNGVTEDGSTVHGGMIQTAQEYGLEAGFLSNEDDLQVIDEITEQGGVVITNGKDSDPSTPATPGGHVIGIRDVEGGLIYLFDSNSRENSQQGFTPEQIFSASRIGYYIMPSDTQEPPAEPAVETDSASAEVERFSPVLNVIADGESNGNYNAYYGNGNNSSVIFTQMTVSEVLGWQASYVAGGSPSSAVGRYQFIQTTLAGLIQELQISPDAKFDENLQDRLAIQLLMRRGASDYINGRISREEFAANLAKEWASLPAVLGSNPQASYYDGDGLNSAHISIDQILDAISRIQR